MGYSLDFRRTFDATERLVPHPTKTALGGPPSVPIKAQKAQDDRGWPGSSSSLPVRRGLTDFKLTQLRLLGDVGRVNCW
jgi:hypothetical protein